MRSSLSLLALVTLRTNDKGGSFFLILPVKGGSPWRAMLELRWQQLIEFIRPNSQECEFSLLVNGYTSALAPW